MTDRENVRFNVLRNALYHTARRRTLEFWNRAFNLAVILLGAAAVGDILSHIGIGQTWTGLGVAVIGALQLVFDFGRQAREHQTLQREYYQLLSEIEAVIDPTAEQIARWQSQQVRIAGDEPPVLRAIDAKAYNDAVGALEWPEDQRIVVPFLHRVFAPIISFEGHQYKKLCEVPRKGHAAA